MSEQTRERRVTGRPAWWAQAVLIGGVIAAVLLLLGVLATRLGLIGLELGVVMVPAASSGLGAVVLLVAIVALIVALVRGWYAERPPLVIGGLLGAVVVAVMGVQMRAGATAPPIHDITTDLVQPPTFEAVQERRGEQANSLSVPAAQRRRVARIQRSAYPEVEPLRTDMQPGAAFEHALETARGMGWEIVATSRDEGRIEATATTFWYGFKDDVVIRVRPLGTGSKIDVRSVSRVGQSDLGKNAERIKTFFDDFRSA